MNPIRISIKQLCLLFGCLYLSSSTSLANHHIIDTNISLGGTLCPCNEIFQETIQAYSDLGGKFSANCTTVQKEPILDTVATQHKVKEYNSITAILHTSNEYPICAGSILTLDKDDYENFKVFGAKENLSDQELYACRKVLATICTSSVREPSALN